MGDRHFPTDVVFTSLAEKYLRYNFHSRVWREQVCGALRSSPHRLLLLLTGPKSIGRRYFIESADFEASASGNTTEVAQIDLDGFEPIGGSLEGFFNHQLSQHATPTDHKIRLVIEGMTKTLKDASPLPWLPLLFSIAKSLKLDPDSILSLSKGIQGPPRHDRETLRLLVKELTKSAILVLHVVDGLTLPLQECLFKMQKSNPKLVVAISYGPDSQLPSHGSNVLRFDFEPYSKTQLRDAIRDRFEPNTFNEGFYDALFRYSGGYPSHCVVKMKDLENRMGFCDDIGWHFVDEECLGSEFDDTLYSPIVDLQQELPASLSASLEKFVQLGALCGEYIPATYLMHFMSLDEEDANELVDAIDDSLVSGEFSILQDYGFKCVGFPENCLVYGFENSLVASVVLRQMTQQERGSVAKQLFHNLRGSLPCTSRAIAKLFMNLLEHANLGDERKTYEEHLAWWIGLEEASELTGLLVKAMSDGKVAPQSLWMAISNDGVWCPSFRRLAILEAYERQPDGIPVGNYPPFCSVKGNVLLAMGRHKEAETLVREAVDICSRTVSEDHPSFAASLSNLGTFLNSTGRYGEAEPLLRQALRIGRKALGEEHPVFAIHLNNLAALLNSTGRFGEAEPLHRQVLEIHRKALGEKHPGFATSLNNLAASLYSTGCYGEAEPLFRRALEIRRKELGKEHPDFAASLHNLAWLMKSTGRYEEAQPFFVSARDIIRKALGNKHPHYRAISRNLAALYSKMERADDAKVVRAEIAALESESPKGKRPH